MDLPTTIFVGPQKTGTTWIHEYLGFRGDICLPSRIKETFFFDQHYDRGLAWYAQHFLRKAQDRHVVEAGPTYFHVPVVPERIRRDLGVIPITVTLRDPIRRAYSQYIHALHYGWTRVPFRQAAESDSLILEPSRYATHLTRWFETFGRENVLVLFQDELASDPDSFVGKICQQLKLDFIAVPEAMKRKTHEASVPTSYLTARAAFFISNSLRKVGWYRIQELARNAGLRKWVYGSPGARPLPNLSEEDARWLFEALRGEIDGLEKLLGMDLSHWKARGARR